MILDFEAESRHKKVLNGIRNKWRNISSKYSQKIKAIKVENKKADKKRLNDFKKRYKAKELSIKNQLELNMYEKLEERKKKAEFSKKKNEDVANNLKRFHEELEEERLKVEESTMKKSNIIIFI